MNKLIDRLDLLAKRHERFIFDLRGDCLVYTGVIAAYSKDLHGTGQGELASAVLHALEHDGIVAACRDRLGGDVRFASCRLFTDQASAERFAQQHQQPTVYNLNREIEVEVCSGATRASAVQRDPEHARWAAGKEPIVQLTA